MQKKREDKSRIFHITRSRKAQMQETQFNWIFVLIVGALILAFFAFIVMKQKASSEAKFAGKASQMLNTILVGAKVSSGTVQEIDTPELSIRFTCSDYYIGPASQRLGTRVVFAPEYVEGNRLITWTLDWNVPYKVASFLYITTPGVRYIIVGQDDAAIGPDSAARWVYDSLPEKLTKDIISYDRLDEMVDENDPYVRIVFVDMDIDQIFDVPVNMIEDTDVSGLVVDMRNPLQKQLQFLEKDGDRFMAEPVLPQEFIEDEIMFGAVFSDNVDEYICLVRRAYQRLSVVAQIYHRKMDLLAPLYQVGNCNGLYRTDPVQGNPHFAAMRDAARSYPLSAGSVVALRSASDALGDANQVAQLRSCPLLY